MEKTKSWKEKENEGRESEGREEKVGGWFNYLMLFPQELSSTEYWPDSLEMAAIHPSRFPITTSNEWIATKNLKRRKHQFVRRIY
jgi:hypothetical protein